MAITGLRTWTCAALGLGLALSLSAGCGGTVAVERQEEELLIGEQVYQRMPGSSATVFLHAKRVLAKLGFKIVSVRENRVINARLDDPKKPIQAYVKIRSDERLCIRLYNLDKDEREEWTERLYSSIAASIEGS